MLISCLLFLFVVPCLADWQQMSSTRAIALRAQRDVMKNTTILNSAVFGVNLNTVLFNNYGYNATSLDYMESLMDVGAQAFELNLYYNEDLGDWGLADFTSNEASFGFNGTSDFNITRLLTRINQFTSITETNLNANIMFLLLNLYSTSSSDENHKTGETGLATTFSNLMYAANPYYYKTLENITLNYYLFGDQLRIIPVIMSNNLGHNASYDLSNDLNLFYEANKTIPIKMSESQDTECVEPSSFQFAYDTEQHPYNNESFRSDLVCGYSAIITQPLADISDISLLLPYTYWSWEASEPNSTISNSHHQQNTNDTTEARDDDYLNRCAISTPNGWKAVSCELKLPVACSLQGNRTHFRLTDDKYSYFEADDACAGMDEGNYFFPVPSTPYEQLSLSQILPSDTHGVWINLNSLSSSNCWVYGGPNALCPYQHIVSRRIFKEMISPASVIALVLFCLIVLVQVDRLPVHRNRKHWRRVLKRKLQNEFEGIPS
ncbi:hypothetical protein OGAPHI_000118 [Ogataea philodendri]|uniref:Maintenance of telomere capping protein 6 n=1 Tax=Ogataea philodendri TaxID=1378263 RepID=A0A9P8PHK1_9ASCO|nr:uncharacterized protein OGAPHI_000118 [Ogataea philodendri]KAH3671932.1 hypothetical protein OGAPHI_000118 [Ogataea philodendri]